jgi:hypothetical protein
MPSMIEAWFSSQWLEQSAVGVEGRGVQDRVLQAEEARDAPLQRLVQILRAADKAHRAQAEAVRTQGRMRGLDDGGVRGQPEVVVGAQVDDLAAIRRAYARALRRRQHALGFVQAGLEQFLQLAAQVVEKGARVLHDGGLCRDRTCSMYRTTFPL